MPCSADSTFYNPSLSTIQLNKIADFSFLRLSTLQLQIASSIIILLKASIVLWLHPIRRFLTLFLLLYPIAHLLKMKREAPICLNSCLPTLKLRTDENSEIIKLWMGAILEYICGILTQLFQIQFLKIRQRRRLLSSEVYNPVLQFLEAPLLKLEESREQR